MRPGSPAGATRVGLHTGTTDSTIRPIWRRPTTSGSTARSASAGTGTSPPTSIWTTVLDQKSLARAGTGRLSPMYGGPGREHVDPQLPRRGTGRPSPPAVFRPGGDLDQRRLGARDARTSGGRPGHPATLIPPPRHVWAPHHAGGSRRPDCGHLTCPQRLRHRAGRDAPYPSGANGGREADPAVLRSADPAAVRDPGSLVVGRRLTVVWDRFCGRRDSRGRRATATPSTPRGTSP